MSITRIKNEKDLAVWALVKLPRITEDGSGADVTITRLRETVRENHFGGDHARVIRLTTAQRSMLESNPD